MEIMNPVILNEYFIVVISNITSSTALQARIEKVLKLRSRLDGLIRWTRKW